VALCVVAAVIMAAGIAVRTDRRMAIAAAIIVVPLLPVANLVPIYRAAADRYLYLPAAGVALAAGLLIDGPWLAGRDGLRDRLVVACAGAAILLGIGCTERQRVWADSLTLWTDTFQKNPVAYTAASGLAASLREAGKLPEAEEIARRAIQLTDGKQGDAWVELALILDGQGRTHDAFEALDKAVEIEPKQADPDGRVAALAMERTTADELKQLQARQKAAR